jgi:hypothetical protein
MANINDSHRIAFIDSFLTIAIFMVVGIHTLEYLHLNKSNEKILKLQR